MITIELRVVPYVFCILTRMTIFWNMDMPRIQKVIPSESFMSALVQKFWSKNRQKSVHLIHVVTDAWKTGLYDYNVSNIVIESLMIGLLFYVGRIVKWEYDNLSDRTFFQTYFTTLVVVIWIRSSDAISPVLYPVTTPETNLSMWTILAGHSFFKSPEVSTHHTYGRVHSNFSAIKEFLVQISDHVSNPNFSVSKTSFTYSFGPKVYFWYPHY